MPHFSRLSDDQKREILEALRSTLDLYDEMEAYQDSLVDSPKLLWRSLRRFDWHPQSDLFDKIEPDDVIEIYSAGNVQVFRNLNFFRYVSLSLEELCSLYWWETTKMEPQAADYYSVLAPKMARNEVLPETFAFPLEPYKVVELIGDRQEIEVSPRWISPLFQGSRCMGLVFIEKLKIL